MAVITRKGLIKSAAATSGASQNLVSAIFDSIVGDIKARYLAGDKIEITGFGTFYPVFLGSRKYRVARLGDARETPGKTTLRFRASKTLYRPEA